MGFKDIGTKTIMKPQQVFPGVFRIGGKLATRSLAPGFKVYGEETTRVDGVEYRFWNAYRSKLGGGLVKGLKTMAVKPGARVLYLGAASGTTASHVSDVVGSEGVVLCVEFAPRSMRDLVAVCERRENMLPLLNDARNPKAYAGVVRDECGGQVDVIFEDVADPEQARILVENAKAFLKKGGHAMIAVKAKSISASEDVQKIFANVEKELEASGAGLKIVEKLDLAPFDLEHEMLVLAKK